MADDNISNQQVLNALTQQISTITDNMATKKDLEYKLKGFATKDDLKGFATKDDLKGFATKNDLKGFATKNDLKGFATKNDVRKIVGEELSSSQTKKFFRTIVREETADIRDEQLKQGVLLEDLDDRFKALAESVSDKLELKSKVDDHDKRVNALESKGKLVISTVTHHSAQIKGLQAAQK